MIVVGIDEVGRGCWAGPLVAGAVILHEPIEGLKDSKKLNGRERERLAGVVQNQAAAVGLGWVWPAVIDEIGLTAAVAEAMRLALKAITISYDQVVLDGNYNFLPDNSKVTTLVKADATIPSVSAASIIAKVARDHYMAIEATAAYPDYGFDKHVGYGTAHHIRALQSYGVTPIHRRSYKPIQQLLLQSRA